MLYALVMLLTIHGHTDKYVVDHHLTSDDCQAMLEQQPAYHVHRAKIRVDFVCERMR